MRLIISHPATYPPATTRCILGNWFSRTVGIQKQLENLEHKKRKEAQRGLRGQGGPGESHESAGVACVPPRRLFLHRHGVC